MSNWKIKKLSLAGRATLVQSVLSTIPLYYMQSTLLPTRICDEIDQASRNFVWGSSTMGRKTNLIAWDKVCQSKDNGGLGFWHARGMNKAMLMKLGWELINRRDKLWVRLLRNKYSCGNNAVPCVNKKQVESNTWRGIRKCWHLVVNNLKWLVHDGHDTLFWTDTWLGDQPLYLNARNEVPPAMMNRTVRSYVNNDGDWDWVALNNFLSTGDCMKLAAVHPPFGTNRKDRIVWKGGKNNFFTVTSANHIAQGDNAVPRERVWRQIWQWNGPPRFKTCLWLIANNKLLSNTERCKRQMTNSSQCPICNHSDGTVVHAIRDCPKSMGIWKSLVPSTHWGEFFNSDISDWVLNNLQGKDPFTTSVSLPWQMTFVVACWTIWRERNNVVFNQKNRDPQQIVFGIYHQAHEINNNNLKLSKLGLGKVETLIGWSFPQDEWVKCNVDGACKGGGAATGCGGVLRDNSGRWLLGFHRGLGMGTVLNAELWGIFLGLQTAWNQGYQKIWLESDSLTSVNLVKNGCSMNHSCSNLVQSILDLCSREWQVHIAHTHREGNRVADILANDGVHSDMFTSLLHLPPHHVMDCLRDDMSGASMPRLISAGFCNSF